MEYIELYTDGSCSHDREGGWACILKQPSLRLEREMFGYQNDTTNNQMELLAVIKGLEALYMPCEVLVTTDSRYVMDGINRGYAKRWRSRQWKLHVDGPLAKNPELWQRLLELCEKHKTRWLHVRGHQGHVENERCDKLAVKARTTRSFSEGVT